MLNNNPPPGKGRVVSDILSRPGLAARFATGCRPQPLWMKFVDAKISQIAQGAYPGW
jgi:hypothetical protein